jgi:hypothetical protein
MMDRQVAELLDRFTPRYDTRAGDWEAVRHAARGRRRRWPLRAGLVLAVGAAAAVAALAWPFQAQQSGFLERALAAIGDGPVLHVVVQTADTATLIDLSTGSRERVQGKSEVWYDSQRGLARYVYRLGGVVRRDAVSGLKEPPVEFVALARDYRQALESGSARVAGEGVVDGEPVAWITISTYTSLDRAEGREHEWARQVAVSRRTLQPLALARRRDDDASPRIDTRILKLELLPAGAGGFMTVGDSTTSARDPLLRRLRHNRVPITLEQARATLGRTPLWLGPEHAGLPFAQAFRETISRGHREEIRVHGRLARAAQACSRLGGDPRRRCFRALPRRPIAVRPDGVFTYTPLVWKVEQSALTLFYGTLADDPSTDAEKRVPRWDRPHLTITQSTDLSRFGLGGRPGNNGASYDVPEGSVLIGDGSLTGAAQIDGLQFFIEDVPLDSRRTSSQRQKAIIATARALEPMPK